MKNESVDREEKEEKEEVKRERQRKRVVCHFFYQFVSLSPLSFVPRLVGL